MQQKTNSTWQPLAFFSKKLNPAQQKYSAYDRELLAIYEAVRHFRYMLEARQFTILTDHNCFLDGQCTVMPFGLCNAPATFGDRLKRPQ
jgi:hypothetical protein